MGTADGFASTGLPDSDSNVSPRRTGRAVAGRLRMSNFGVTTGSPVVVRVCITGVRRLTFRAFLADFGAPGASFDAFFFKFAERRWLAACFVFPLAKSALCRTRVAVKGFVSNDVSVSAEHVLATNSDEVAGEMLVMGTLVSQTSLKGRFRISSGTVRMILSYHKSTLRQMRSTFSCMAKREFSRVHSSSLTIHCRYLIWSTLRAVPGSREDWRAFGFFVRGISGGGVEIT